MNGKSSSSASKEGTGGHIEQQPLPGHTENIPANPSRDEQRSGASEERAPDAAPDTKPGTPPGTQRTD